MPETRRFRHGDEARIIFLARPGGKIMHLAGWTVRAEVWAFGRKIFDLDPENVVVTNNCPPVATEGEAQTAHGFVRILESDSENIPFGRIAFVRLIFESLGGDTISDIFYLEKLR